MSRFQQLWAGVAASLVAGILQVAAKPEPVAGVTKILQQKCVRCHGGEKTKGQMDIAALLKRGFSFDDVDGWSRVFAEIQGGNMPPEDEKEVLSKGEGKTILDTLLKKLGQSGGASERRMITPDEFKNSIADLFQVDLNNYDPYGDLLSYVSPPHKFLTVDSSRMMNRFYLHALKDGTEQIIRGYHSGNQPVHGNGKSPVRNEKGQARFEQRVDKWRQKKSELKAELLADGTLSEEDRQLMVDRRDDGLQGVLEGEIARRTPKSTNFTQVPKFPMKMSPKIKDTTDGFFEYSDEHWGIRGKSWIGNNNMPIMLLGGYGQQFRIQSPGKYRLTICATATDRDTISNVPKVQTEDAAWWNNGRLQSEPCKLTLFKDAHRTKTRSDPLMQATPVGAFYIEDNVIKDYTIDIAFHWNSQLGILFENGVTNVIKAEGLHPIMYYDDNNEIVYTKSEKRLPTIRIYDVTLERIGDVEMGGLYIQDIENFDDAKAEEKLLTFAQLAYLDNTFESKSFYQALRKTGLAPFDAYVDTLKWLCMTADFLYVDPDSPTYDGQLRHAAFSLLKSIPTKAFADAYLRFYKVQSDAKAFTDSIVADESFANFTRSFARQWLEFSEIAVNAPDRVKFAPFYDDNLAPDFEAESSAYIQHLFEENRKLVELVDADYQFANDELGVLYGIAGLRHDDVRKVPATGKNPRLGVLGQAGLMTALANGVEDLPFKRAKWISENLLDKKIPPPPDEIDVTEFGQAEDKDFASRIEVHKASEDCRTCHRLLDPMAIDIHMFDVLGRIKKDEFSLNEAEHHLLSLKETVTASERRIASAFTKNLLTFMTGHKPGIQDLQTVDQILNQTRADGYRARDILAGIISHYFRPDLDHGL